MMFLRVNMAFCKTLDPMEIMQEATVKASIVMVILFLSTLFFIIAWSLIERKHSQKPSNNHIIVKIVCIAIYIEILFMLGCYNLVLFFG